VAIKWVAINMLLPSTAGISLLKTTEGKHATFKRELAKLKSRNCETAVYIDFLI